MLYGEAEERSEGVVHDARRRMLGGIVLRGALSEQSVHTQLKPKLAKELLAQLQKQSPLHPVSDSTPPAPTPFALDEALTQTYIHTLHNLLSGHVEDVIISYGQRSFKDGTPGPRASSRSFRSTCVTSPLASSSHPRPSPPLDPTQGWDYIHQQKLMEIAATLLPREWAMKGTFAIHREQRKLSAKTLTESLSLRAARWDQRGTRTRDHLARCGLASLTPLAHWRRRVPHLLRCLPRRRLHPHQSESFLSQPPEMWVRCLPPARL